MKKLIFIFILSTLYCIPTTASAQEASLTVSPPLLEIEAIPPIELETPIIIRNDSQKSVTLQIMLKPFTAYSETGDIQFLEGNDAFPGANPKIIDRIKVREKSIPISEVTLGPKEEKKLDLYIGLAASEPHSDYYFGIVFLPTGGKTEESDSEEDQNASSIQGGIGINVLLSVGPRTDAKGLIQEFSAPRFLSSGPVPFTVRVKNTGSKYITPKGTIIITNMFGQKIGRVNLLSSNILPGTIRAFINEDLYKETLRTEATREKSNNTAQEEKATFEPKAIWPETFLVGPYTATLRMSLSPEGPELVRDYRFFAFPTQLLLGLILGIALFLTIRTRLKRKLAQ